jgi:predicted YcjX-like family ATPase
METTKRGVTFQVSLSPTDYLYARHTLPHQLRQWASQVDEVLLVTDLHKVRRGHFSEGWEERRAPLAALVAECSMRHPNVRACDIDYSDAAQRRVSATFGGGRPLPPKDLRGSPIYGYFYALDQAAHDVVFHIDSDMMFGGGSQRWIANALALLDADPDILACSPLPGPPTRDGTLPAQPTAVPYRDVPNAFRFRSFSSRIYCFSKARFFQRIGNLAAERPPWRGVIRAVLQGNNVADMTENVWYRKMNAAGMYRVDFLGEGPGMWSLHPPLRGQKFYDELPALIARIEAGDVPDAQRGYYDIQDALFDWSSARAAKGRRPWWIRLGVWATGNPYRHVPRDAH